MIPSQDFATIQNCRTDVLEQIQKQIAFELESRKLAEFKKRQEQERARIARIREYRAGDEINTPAGRGRVILVMDSFLKSEHQRPGFITYELFNSPVVGVDNNAKVFGTSREVIDKLNP